MNFRNPKMLQKSQRKNIAFLKRRKLIVISDDEEDDYAGTQLNREQLSVPKSCSPSLKRSRRSTDQKTEVNSKFSFSF